MVNSMLSDSLRRSYMSGDGSLLYARPFAGNYSRGTAEDGFNGSQGGVSLVLIRQLTLFHTVCMQLQNMKI